MKGSMRAAMAIGVGYALGRRKKFRTATVLAAATAFGGTGVSSVVLQRGMKMLASSDVFGKLTPQLGEIVDTVRGDLLDAGKAAVGAAVTNQLDSLTGSIHERADRLRNPADAAAAGAGEATEAAGSATSTAGGAARKASRGDVPSPREQDDRDQDDREQDDRDQEDYEAGDLSDQDRDDQNRGEPDDDYDEGEGERDDFDEGEPDDDDAEPVSRPTRDRPAAPARRGNSPRRSPVSRARG